MELELVPKEAFDQSVANQNSGKAAGEEEKMVYTGRERRIGQRRITVDRREMVRFESKPDRRQHRERREDLRMWDGRDI